MNSRAIRSIKTVRAIKVKSCDWCPFHYYDDGCSACCDHPDMNNRKTPFEFDDVNNPKAVTDRLPLDCPLIKNAVVISWDKG